MADAPPSCPWTFHLCHLCPPPLASPASLAMGSLGTWAPCFTSEDSPERPRGGRRAAHHLTCLLWAVLVITVVLVGHGTGMLGCSQDAQEESLPLGLLSLGSQMAALGWAPSLPHLLFCPNLLPATQAAPVATWGRASQTVLATVSCHSFRPQRPALLPCTHGPWTSPQFAASSRVLMLCGSGSRSLRGRAGWAGEDGGETEGCTRWRVLCG